MQNNGKQEQNPVFQAEIGALLSYRRLRSAYLRL